MGSSLSTVSRTAAQRSAVRAQPPKPTTASPPTAAKPSSSDSAPITARVQEQKPQQQPSLYQRPTTDDWAAALKKMSAVITTSSWDDRHRSESLGVSRERHPAQRSSATAQKLPQQRSRTLDGMDHDAPDAQRRATSKPPGRLSQLDVMELFNLRRQQSEQWHANALSAKYNVHERDLIDLLHFTRTYTARLDKDGQMRGYYNVDRNNTIKRFEKD